jgi:Na+-transporting NADH:ubiquinone oxidoreductase subunit NqrD
MLLQLIILIVFGEECNYEAPDYAVFSSLLLLHPSNPNILLNILGLCSSLNVRNQVSYPYQIRFVVSK